MIVSRLNRTASSDEDFVTLVRRLDAELADRDGLQHGFYDQYNKIANIRHVIVCYIDDLPVACGAIKEFEAGTMEVKRMYVEPAFRGQRIGAAVLDGLERWALELGYAKCVLETGKRQPEAIRLYEKSGYRLIPNYGQYVGIENSVCFEKRL